MNGFDWVTIKKASESTGLGESALRHYIEDGVWLEGVEYVRREQAKLGEYIGVVTKKENEHSA